MNQPRLLPKESIEEWPEIYGEVTVSVLPLHYLHSIRINFKDQNQWEIVLTSRHRNSGWEAFERNLSDLLIKYENDIESIDFKLDTIRLKKDIIKKTTKFFKKNKI